MFTVCVIIGAFGLIFCIFWIKKAENSKDRFYAVFSLLGCLIVGLSSFWGITYENDLLWYGQNEKNANIQIDFSATDVEGTSILAKMNLVNSNTTPDEIKRIFGYNCTVDTSDKYTIIYENPNYTLNSYNADFLRIEFNKKGTKIKQISWGYRNPQSFQVMVVLTV